MDNDGGRMMDTENKKIVMVVDDSLLICKQIRAALSDADVFICEAHTCLLYTSRCV